MKTKLTEVQLNKITELFNNDIGSRKIANIIGVNRSTIIKAYRQLNLDSATKKTPCFAYKALYKHCNICSQTKSIENFRKRLNKKTNRISFESYCKICEYLKIKEILKKKAKILRQTNPNFVIRRSISYFIWKSLSKSNSNKQGKSCLDYLGYTIDDLKKHLESLFESWMTWDNHGNYNSKTWDDNDKSTWIWQIDHIIPQSSLPYNSMQDDNFKKCWMLDNLRPLSAKQNNKDGISKIRHKNI